MNSLHILAGSIRIFLFILAVTFAYYSIYKAKIMISSKGRQIMAGSTILSIIASISSIMDVLLPASSKTILFTFSLWTIFIITFVFGVIITARSINRIYHDSLLKITLKHPVMIKDLIGSLILIFLGIPAYILDIIYITPNKLSLIDILNTIIWIFGLGNLTGSPTLKCGQRFHRLISSFKRSEGLPLGSFQGSNGT